MSHRRRNPRTIARKEVLTIADQSSAAYGDRLDAALWKERVRRRRRRARTLCRLATEPEWADMYFVYRRSGYCGVCDGPHSDGVHGLVLLLEEMFTPKPAPLTYTLFEVGYCFDFLLEVQRAA